MRSLLDSRQNNFFLLRKPKRGVKIKARLSETSNQEAEGGPLVPTLPLPFVFGKPTLRRTGSIVFPVGVPNWHKRSHPPIVANCTLCDLPIMGIALRILGSSGPWYTSVSEPRSSPLEESSPDGSGASTKVRNDLRYSESVLGGRRSFSRHRKLITSLRNGHV